MSKDLLGRFVLAWCAPTTVEDFAAYCCVPVSRILSWIGTGELKAGADPYGTASVILLPDSIEDFLWGRVAIRIGDRARRGVGVRTCVVCSRSFIPNQRGSKKTCPPRPGTGEVESACWRTHYLQQSRKQTRRRLAAHAKEKAATEFLLFSAKIQEKLDEQHRTTDLR